jgi:hypothetical protein
MSFTEKLNQRILERNAEKVSAPEIEDFAETDQVELFETSEFFGKEQVRNMPACLELRYADGTSKAFPYSFIMEINFNPSEGIEIITTQKKILIEGRNLKMLYIFLLSFQVRFIQENIGADQTEEGKLFVRGIKMEEV